MSLSAGGCSGGECEVATHNWPRDHCCNEITPPNLPSIN